MRTRFLTPFSPVSSSSTDFLRLPLPPLPPTPDSSPSTDHLHCFQDASLFSFEPEIESFEIQNALAKFLSDAVPQDIDINIDDFEIFDLRKLLLHCEAEESNDGVNREEKLLDNVDFEVTEPDISLLPLGNAPDFQKEIMHIVANESHDKSDESMPSLEVRLQNYLEVERAVYSIDDITSDYSIKQQSQSPEDNENTLGICRSHKSDFPLFEVDETHLVLFGGDAGDQLLIFESIVTQICMQEVEQIVNDKDPLGLAQFDLLDYVSDHLGICARVEVPHSNFFEEMELIVSIDHSNTMDRSQEIANDYLTSSKTSYTFEELQYLEPRAAYCFEIFSVAALISEMVTCETMFSEAMNFKNFSDLVVSCELTLMDDSFKALPVPILLDHEQIKPLHCFIEETLKLLEPQHLSTSDGIYLDWHFLVEDYGRSIEGFSEWKLLQDINYCGAVYDFDTPDLGMLVDRFIFSDNVTHSPHSKEDKENLNIPSVFTSAPVVFPGYTTDAALRIFMKDESTETVTAALPYKSSSEHITSSVQSMSDFRETEYLIPLESGRRKESKLDSVVIAAENLLDLSSDPSTTCTHLNMQLHQWNIILHPVKMSNYMLDLINCLNESFAAILENDVGLSKYPYAPETKDGISYHNILEEKLQSWINCISKGKAGLSHDNNNDAFLMVLHAIKQTAWYILYYGIHAAYIYMNKLCTTMELFRLKLSSPHQMIEEAHMMAEKDIHKIHPSLAVVQEILQAYKSLKILIVAERVYWLPLKRLLTSIGLSYYEPHQHSTSNSYSDKCYVFPDDEVNSMLCTDCSLISSEFISPSFPFNKYAAILEYGGPLISSRLSTISTSPYGCVLHFIKVDFQDSSVCRAICDGLQMLKTINYKLEGGLLCKSNLNWSINKIQELLSFVPYQESSDERPSELMDEGKTCSFMPGLAANCKSSTLQKQICPSEPSLPKNIIIVNTLNIGKDMIICRRSTYQQILALEKKGFQVIERDLNFPVDVTINAAVCLAWYNSKNIGKQAAPNDPISCLPIFVENLAESILTSISFSFSGCIMVFEGGSSYIAGIMESSDELYAAAASLGIDLQLFYSYSSEMTDKIILSCIKMVTISARDLYPKISDSETLAESFLTTFPSINPLSAHAILSTGGNLVNYLEWSPECRIRAVQKFHVPDESITLLSALSRFGEKENSVSGMTECSSSVSSGIDSENIHCKRNYESKKHKYMQNNVDMDMQDPVYQCSLELLSNEIGNSHGAFGPFTSEIFHDFGKTNLSCKDEMFGHSRLLDSKMTMMKHPSMTEQCDLLMTNGRSSISLEPEHRRSSCEPGFMLNVSEMFPAVNVPQIPQSDKFFSPHQMSNMLERNKRIDTCNKWNSGNLQDVIGEVINIDDTGYFRDQFDADLSVTRSKHQHDMDRDTKLRLFSFPSLSPPNVGSHPTFPSAAEIESEGKRWFSEQAYGKGSVEETPQQREIVEKQVPGVIQKGLLEEWVLQKADMNFDDPSIPCRRTPLSDAIESTQLQQGSPWTIEFLNRMREKSKQKRQFNPNAISSHSYGSVWDGTRTAKRKSPSLLESFKFQGGKPTKKGIELKRQSRFVKPSNSSKAGKPPISSAPSWTPVDKRARRKLSFSTNGNGGQSKLVWER